MMMVQILVEKDRASAICETSDSAYAEERRDASVITHRTHSGDQRQKFRRRRAEDATRREGARNGRDVVVDASRALLDVGVTTCSTGSPMP